MNDFKHQWEQLSGYAYEISEDVLRSIAGWGVSNLHMFAEILWGGIAADPATQARIPIWASVGMDRHQWESHVASWQEQYERATGNKLDLTKAGDLEMMRGRSGLSLTATAGELKSFIEHDKGMRETYGWLKHGMNHDDFLLQKNQMRQAFGAELSDQQAILQLDYFHKAQGSSMAVHAQTRQRGQQGGPVEVSESVVR
jgi:hypothetical protein